MTGFIDAKDGKYNFWGRPAYMLQMPDGSLLVSDEQLGAIYRVSYVKKPEPASDGSAPRAAVGSAHRPFRRDLLSAAAAQDRARALRRVPRRRR